MWDLSVSGNGLEQNCLLNQVAEAKNVGHIQHPKHALQVLRLDGSCIHTWLIWDLSVSENGLEPNF